MNKKRIKPSMLASSVFIISGLFFQNITSAASTIIKPVELIPSTLEEVIFQGHPRIGKKNSSATPHELKFQGNGLVPKISTFDKKKVLKFQISGKENTIYDRSELRIMNTTVDFGTNAYIGFKVYYPSSSSLTSKDGWSIIWQCPQLNMAISPPLSLSLQQGKIILNRKNDDNSRKKILNSYDEIGELPRDRWVKIIIRFQMGLKGNIAVFLDGKPAKNFYGPIGYFNTSTVNSLMACSSRIGIYKYGSSVEDIILYFDSIKFGPNYPQL